MNKPVGLQFSLLLIVLAIAKPQMARTDEIRSRNVEGSFQANVEERSNTSTPELPPDQRIANFEGDLEPGGHTTMKFLVDLASKLRITGGFIGHDPNEHERLVNDFWSHVTIIDPLQQRIHPAQLPADGIAMSLEARQPRPERANWPAIVIENPVPGRWTLELDAEGASRPLSYQISILAEGTAIEFSLRRPDQMMRPLAPPILIQAQLLDHGRAVDLPKGAVRAEVLRYFEGTRTIYDLNDQGLNGDAVARDGLYTAELPIKRSGGYRIEVTASDGKTFQRSEDDTMQLAAIGVTMTRRLREVPADTDGNGVWDTLQFLVQVNRETEGGNYILRGMIHHKNEAKPDYTADAPIPPSIGQHEVVFPVPGRWLQEEEDGTCWLRLSILDLTSLSDIDHLEQDYQLSYPISDFESR